jgi:hypothetical protein
MSQRSNITRRGIISNLLITVLNGFAIKVAMERVHLIIVQHGFNIPGKILILPLILFLTIFRFLVGNILHMRNIEERITSPIIWSLDLVFVVFESMLFVLMGYFIFDNCQYFCPFLLILCIVDVVWILLMLVLWKIGLRFKPPLGWGILNFFSALYLVLLLKYEIPFAPLTEEGLVLTFVVFTIAFVIDVFYLDYYKILRKKTENQ